MRLKIHRVFLTDDDRAALSLLVSSGIAPARQITHARILLKADEGPDGPASKDAAIAAALEVDRATVARVRRLFVCDGRDAALRHRLPRATKPRTLSGADESHLIALACSAPPTGRECWSVRLLAAEFVTVESGTTVSRELVRRTLKKGALKPWLKECWCIPPKQSAAFVACMEDVLDVSTRPDDPRFPQVCMDKTHTQLLGEVREPLPAAPGRAARHDPEYARGGVANRFLVCEPLRGWRHATVTERRIGVDWARCVKELADVHYPDAEKIVLVLDQFNTHTAASLYEAFPPAEAKRIAERLEIHHTPKHGRWLNMAEIEFSVLVRQCLGQRMGDAERLEAEVGAWETARNHAASRIDWRFTTADARIKLKHRYPITLSDV